MISQNNNLFKISITFNLDSKVLKIIPNLPNANEILYSIGLGS